MTIDAYTKILLECEGTDGAQTFVDSCSSPKALTVSGNIHNSTAGSKYGSASAKASNTEGNDFGYLYTTSTSSDFDIYNQDYGMSGWLYLIGIFSNAYFTVAELQSASPSASVQIGVEIDDNGTTAYLRHYVNSVLSVSYTIPGGISINAWHHLAVTRRSGVTRIFLDGVLVATCSSEKTITQTSNYKFCTGNSVWGFLDQVEFTLGIARWISDFTPAQYYEYVGPQTYYIDVSDTIGMADDTYGQDVYITDGFGASDISDRNLVLTPTISDTARFTDKSIMDIAITIQESLGMTDLPTTALCIMLNEYLSFVDSQVVNNRGTRSVFETLDLDDSSLVKLGLSLSDSIGASDSVTANVCIAILEVLGFDDLVTAIGRLRHSVVDDLDMSDMATAGYVKSVSDALGIVDTLSVVNIFISAISENLSAADTAVGKLISSLPVLQDSLSLTESVTSQGHLYDLVYDTIRLDVAIDLGGEVWECYVLNTPKFLPSIYSGFDFNSYCIFQNRAFGANSSGIYELSGDTDDGVKFHTGAKLSDTCFNIPNQKRFKKAYMGISGAKPVLVMETEKGISKAYSIDSVGKANLSGALKSRKWKTSIVDFDSLDYIRLYPVVLVK